jgi:4-hydroxy-3-methylbut-2-enyl diphosphate reductase
METDSHDGGLILSKKRADFEEAWDRVLEAHRGGKPVTAMVTDRVKGGLVVDLGIRGFVPASHVGGGNVKNLDRFVGQSLPLKIIEVDRERRKVILSHRQAVEGERDKRRSETLKTLSEGQVRDGAVRRITDYGAFVDLGGIDGLLHISEMSWTRINHPSEVVKVGQKIQVMILKLNLQQDRVSLGLRQILPDPWGDIAARYTEGDLVRGRVSRLVPFGAFVRLEGGIEGIIPNVELSRKRVKRADDVIGVGDEVEARVIDINREERRMTLSIRQVHEEKEKAEFDTYRSGARDETRTTLGDLIGDKLKEYRTQVVEHDDEGTGKKPERRKRRQSRKVEEDADEHVELDMIEEPVEEAEAPAAPEGLAAEPAPAPAEDVDETATEAVFEPVEVAAEAAPTESTEGKAPAAEEEAGETV